jgi:hypothetical protein
MGFPYVFSMEGKYDAGPVTRVVGGDFFVARRVVVIELHLIRRGFVLGQPRTNRAASTGSTRSVRSSACHSPTSYCERQALHEMFDLGDIGGSELRGYLTRLA